jgi:hypothetical protein
MPPAPTPFHPRFPIGMQFALMNQSGHQFRVQLVAQGAAVAVVPVGESITAEPLRESLTETIQRSLPASRASIDIKFFAVPCEVGSFVGVVVGGFADSPEAGSISALIVFLILALSPVHAAVLRRRARGPPDRGRLPLGLAGFRFKGALCGRTEQSAHNTDKCFSCVVGSERRGFGPTNKGRP